MILLSLMIEVGEAIQKKYLLLLEIFAKGGVMSESKRFEELFCSVHVWTFFRKGGGGWVA